MNYLFEKYYFLDDGTMPNSELPVIVYRQVTQAANKTESLEDTFKTNGWTNNWRDTVYGYDHFHSITHEVLGIGDGSLILRIGGRNGLSLALEAGDVVILPAGTGHSAVSEHLNYTVVGGYPKGMDWDLLIGNDDERAQAVENISRVPLPETDPVFGLQGELQKQWQYQEINQLPDFKRVIGGC
ncbi:cupin [Emticicia fluvialis]|uniref:cupin n=1 Tax=Emticicia fluvialis TaxID=2974474 RepID=UPI002166A2DC|nr:cupin [Emticicia fluvialis]